jgi:hypothetical protein
MGGKTISTTATAIAGIQIQTSSYGLTIPVVFGTNRVAANLVWFGNFTPVPHTTSTSSGGKGIGKVTSKDTTYTYTAAAILAVAEGPIAGIRSVWKDKDKTTLGALGLTVFTGSPTQATWSFLTGYNTSGNWAAEQAYGYNGQGASFTNQAINYSGTAYLASGAYDLGDSAAVPNHGFEVQGFNIYSGKDDANPADIIPVMTSSQQFGMGLSLFQIDPLTQYSLYCRAAGLFFSPAYTDQAAGADRLKELTDASNSAILWSNGLLKIIPYGDKAISANGATYTPNMTPLFDLTDDDFQPGDDPVRISRSTPDDAPNSFSMEILNRAGQYNAEIVTSDDQAQIERFGLKAAPVITAHFICDSTVAKNALELIKQRAVYIRNNYEFDLDARYPMLEPMDIVTLTDAGMNMLRFPVRIIQIDENDDGYTVTAEDLLIGSASAAAYTHDNGLRWQQIINASPMNAAAPIIFELPADPNYSGSTGLTVGIAVGGQASDLLYGGCRVWLSLDGTNYKNEGVIYGSSRYGITTSALPAHAPGSDTTTTLGISLRSNRQMISGSAADVAKGTTLMNVGGEFLAYQAATLTGTNAYNLTTLNRGLYNTTAPAQAAGAPWVRIDDAIAILSDLDLKLIGQTVYIKLTAFNTYRTGEQDLSAVSAYTYTITGNVLALQTPIDFATGVGGITKPAPYAGTSLGLVDVSYSGTLTIKANGFIGNGSGGDWTTGVADKNYYTSGFAAGRLASLSRIMFGLGSPTSYSAAIYSTMEYAIYQSQEGTGGGYFIYELGASIYNIPSITPAAGDYLDVVNDGAVVRYYINGALVYKSLVAPNGKKLRLVCSVGSGSQATAVFTDIQAGPSLSAIDTLAGSLGQNLLYNGGAELGTIAGWAPSYSSGTVGTQVTTTVAQSGLYSFFLSKAATSGAIGLTSNAVQVAPGDQYTIRVWIYANAAQGSGFYLRVEQGNAVAASGIVSPTTGLTDIRSNAAVAAGAQLVTYLYTVPAGVTFISLSVVNYIGGPTQMFFEASMVKSVDFTNGLTGTGKPEAYATGSDNTIFNSALLADTTGWKVDPGPFRQAIAGYPLAAWFQFPVGAANAIANDNSFISLNGAKSLYVSSYRYVSAGATGSFYVGIDFYDASGTYVGYSYTLDMFTGGGPAFTLVNGTASGWPTNATQYIVHYTSNFTAGVGNGGGLRVARTQDAADVTATAPIINTGSIPPTIPSGTFAYSANTTSCTISWPLFTINRANGTSFTVSAGSYVISSLTANIWQSYPYVVDAGGSGPFSMSFATGGYGSPSAAMSTNEQYFAAITLQSQNGNVGLGYIRFNVPSSGSTGGGGGGGGGIGCVDAASFMPFGGLASDVDTGFELALLRDGDETFDVKPCEQVRYDHQPCVRITTASGISLVCSLSTPITTRNGRVCSIDEALGIEVPVLDLGEFRWERIISIAEIGSRVVAMISAGNGTYAAGELNDDRYIFTHNVSSKYF